MCIIEKNLTKLTKSTTETISKVDEPKTYDEVIDNPIYRNK